MKSRDSRIRSQLLLNAYVESLVGAFALHLPGVGDIVRAHAPLITVDSSYPSEPLNLHADAVINDLVRSGPRMTTLVDQITAAFIAGMWDILQFHAHYEQIATNPDVQFFRHLRNACGHDGSWNFGYLKHRAAWRDKELLSEQSGLKVFGGLLKHGDVMLLMKDIDSKYFDQ
jgi:hypothetical protein